MRAAMNSLVIGVGSRWNAHGIGVTGIGTTGVSLVSVASQAPRTGLSALVTESVMSEEAEEAAPV